MKIKLIIIFTLIQIGLFGQSSFDGIDTSLIKPWLPKIEIEYQAVYHFGDSEWESKLILICGLDKWYAQIVSGNWSGEGNQLAWINNYENLGNVRVDANKFYSDKTNGEFVLYDGNNGRIKGLKVYNSWIGEDGQEIGYKSHSLQDNYSGKYTQASLRLLNRDELIKMSKTDLKIMRNEIFARYGYKFKPGGEMDKYFQSLDWYSGQHDNVDKFLTDLEKENIDQIQLIENK
jgi:hypothetical protein